MKYIADQLEQYTDSRDNHISCLSKSIALLNRRIGWVPKGWVPIYQELVKSLMNLNDDPHGEVRVVGPWVEGGRMEFTSRNLTPVVAGILRKTTRRSQCTCNHCGHPGKLRSFGEETREVLCARCYAPRELAEQLASWIPRLDSADFLESESVLVVDDLDPAFLALIPHTKWRWVSNGVDGEPLPYLLSKEMVDLLPDLKKLHSLVVEMASADE
jgi:hypothetical protein